MNTLHILFKFECSCGRHHGLEQLGSPGLEGTFSFPTLPVPQEAKSQRQAKEAERLQRELVAMDKELHQLDTQKNLRLQRIENERTRAEALLGDDRATLEAKVTAQSGSYRSVSRRCGAGGVEQEVWIRGRVSKGVEQEAWNRPLHNCWRHCV